MTVEQDLVVHNNEIDVLMAIPGNEIDKVRRRAAFRQYTESDGDCKTSINIPLHQDQGRLLGHHVVNDTLNPLLVLIQDLLANAALDRGLDLCMACNIFLDIEPANVSSSY